jgi:hypothetical protein
MHGVAQALVPGITGWVDSGFAMPNSPLDMWKGQWKGGGNFLSHTVEGMINSGPLGKLVHLATGYRLDLPSFDIPAQQQMGAAAFDAGMITLSVVAPEARLPALNWAGRVANSESQVAYRALTAADDEALQQGRGLLAKAPDGTWTAAEHVANSGPGAGGAAANSPWISTNRNLDVAKAYDSGNGIIAIDLNKLDALQVEVWRAAPRVNGVQGLPYHRSIWAQEVTIHQRIPFDAVLGPVK